MSAVPAGPSAPFAAPSAGQAATAGPSRRRPRVLDASRTALIPLRPLTLAEILDASFVVLRANARHVVLLPLFVIGSLILLITGSGIALALVGDLIGAVWVVVLSVLGGFAALVLLVAGATWVSSALTRASLQTVLGPGFAPAPPRLDVRGMISLLPPMLGMIALQAVALNIASIPLGMLGIALTLPLDRMDDLPAAYYGAAVLVLLTLLMCWLMSYLTLAVPAYTAENSRTPGWIGKPQRPTTIISVYARTVRLIGLRNAPRACLVMAGGVFLGLLLMTLGYVGFVELVLVYAQALGVPPLLLLMEYPLVLIGALGTSLVLSMSVWLGYFATLQTVLYVDLRMRREGLDLAMRFDAVEVPQPVAPLAPQWGHRSRTALPPGAPPTAAADPYAVHADLSGEARR